MDYRLTKSSKARNHSTVRTTALEKKHTDKKNLPFLFFHTTFNPYQDSLKLLKFFTKLNTYFTHYPYKDFTKYKKSTKSTNL